MKEKNNVLIEVVPGKGTYVVKTRYTETAAEIKYEWCPKLDDQREDAAYKPLKVEPVNAEYVPNGGLFAIIGGVRIPL